MKRYLPLIAAALGLGPAATGLQAQGCGAAGCGPVSAVSPVSPGCGPLVSACVHGRPDCGPCGLKQYPLMEKRYIRQFCRPTISPDSCFGYFRPQITPWSEACPNWSGPDIPYPGPYMFQRASASAPVPSEEPKMPVAPAPAPATKPKEVTPIDAMPMPGDTLPKPPSSPLPTPKETKPMLPPPPMPMDPLGKPPTLPIMPKEDVKPKDGRSAGLPEVPTIPSLPPLPSVPTSTRVPY